MEGWSNRKLVISFYIRFYRHILAEYSGDSIGNMYPWLKRVADYVLPYEYLATKERIAQNERTKSLEMLMVLLIPPHKNAHFDGNLYKIKIKSMKQRSQIYGNIFAKINNFEEFVFQQAERIKFTIRNSVLPLLDSIHFKKGEAFSLNSALGKDSEINFATKKSELLELCAPIKNENYNSESWKNEEVKMKFLEKENKSALCLDFLLKDGLLEKAIENQVKMGKTWRQVFGAIRVEMLSWGGENPLLEKLDKISEKFAWKFEQIESIKILNKSKMELIRILLIFTSLFREMEIGLDEFVLGKLTGENGEKKEGTVLEAFLEDDSEILKKKVELAKIL